MTAATAEKIATASISKAASEIQAAGLKHPDLVYNTFKGLTREQAANLFANLSKIPAGRAALQTVQRIWLDKATPTLAQFLLKHKVAILAGVTSGALWYSFLGFPFEEADQRVLGSLVGLVNEGMFTEANEFLPRATEIMGRVTGSMRDLRGIPIIGDLLGFVWGPEADAAELSFDTIKAQIERGLEEEAAGTTI